MKTVLITGSNRGIGRALVEHFLSTGYLVYAGSRMLVHDNAENKNLRRLVIDVQDDKSISSAIEYIKKESGSLDLLINNAGISKGSEIIEDPKFVSKLESLERSKLITMFDVNTVSPLIVAKYAVPIMTNSGSFIVNLSSLRATIENSKNGNGNYGYSSSKLALNMMTLCLVHDLPENISTFTVHPGSVETDMNPNGRMTPNESANAIAAIIENWKLEFNGRFLNYDGSCLS